MTLRKCSTISLIIVLLISSLHSQDHSKQENLVQKIGKEFFQGIFRSNYREIPLDEIVQISHLSLPHPKLTWTVTHPTLLFRNGSESQIRLRRHHSPYREWAENIIESALDSGSDPASPLITEIERSRIAKLNGFAYFLTFDPFFSDRALSALKHIRESDPIRSLEGGRKDVGWGDWMQASEALCQYAVAYDLLFEILTLNERKNIEDHLSEQAEQMVNHLEWIPKNNHAIAIASAIGTVALVIPNPFSQRWLDAAMDQFESSLSKIEPDGSYREGVYYARFVASRFYPFALYLENVTGFNLLQHRRLRRFNRWLIDMEKPDGTVPDFDDAFPENYLYMPLGIGLLPESGEMVHQFTGHMDRYDSHDSAWIEAFCAFDVGMPSVQPDYDSATFYPDGGMAVFRGGKEIYGLFLGEPGRPHLSGHDHAEPTAFSLSAFGTELLIDVGYGPKGVDDPNRAWYVSGEAHNIPLVNGLGPDQNPVWGDDLGGKLYHYFKTESISSATVSARYRESDIQRTIWFVGGNYFVVLDHCKSDTFQHFTIPWHGLGQLYSAGKHQVRWENGDVHLEAHFLRATEEPATLITQTGLHTRDIQNGQHRSVMIHLPLSKEQELVSLFFPQKTDEWEIDHIPEPVLCEGQATGTRIFSNNSKWEDVLVIAEGPWQNGPFVSNGRIGLYRKSGNKEVSFFTIVEANYVRIGSEAVFESDFPVNMTLILDDQGWYGYVGCSEKTSHFFSSPTTELKMTTITFFPSIDPGCVLLGKEIVSYTWKDQRLVLHLDRDGILEMGPQSHRIRTTETVYENLPMLQRLGQLPDPSIMSQSLTHAELIQLRNEIVQETGRIGLQCSDSLLGGSQRTAALYGIASGLLNAVYQQTGEAHLRIPQKMDIRHDLFQHRISYFEEGMIDQSGLNVRRHHIGVDQTLWVSHERLFDHHQMTRIQLNRNHFGLEVFVEDWEEDQAYHIGVHRNKPNGWLSVSHSEWLKDMGRMSLFSLGHNNWSGSAIIQSQSDNGLYYFSIEGKHQTQWITSIVDFRTQEGQGLTVLQLQNSWRCSPNIMICTDLEERRDLDNDFWEYQFSSFLWFHMNQLNGTLRTQRDWNGQYSGNWTSVFKHGHWRFDSRGLFGPLLTGDIGIARRSKTVSWQTRFSRGKYGMVNLTWHPGSAWISTFRMNSRLSNFKTEEAALGLYYYKLCRLGGEIRFVNDEAGRQLMGLTGVVNLSLCEYETLSLYTTTLFEENGNFDYLEILLTQSGRVVTPGLLMIRDNRNLVRFEGYLMWRL